MNDIESGLHNVPKERIPATAWRLLQGGCDAARDPLHTPVLATRIDFLDWLVLSIKGHRRAQFVWKDGKWSGAWVAP